MNRLLRLLTICSLITVAVAVAAQTFEIGGQENTPQAPKSKSKSGKPETSSGIGWGSSIEVGRMARAAENALAKGDAASAANYAQRAVQTAPQNSKLWFLLGYSARLAGRYGQSLDAYQRGLQIDRSSVEGLSGMAQTYVRMGRLDEAKRLLMQVIASNPKRANDLAVAGELFMQTGDLPKGMELLQRAESLTPSAHSELLLAVGYMKSKQPDKAKQMLEIAKRRAPNSVDVFRAVANYYREVRDYKSAIATLKAVPRKTSDVLADLGYSYELNGDKKEAAQTYAQAANAAPKQLNFQLSAANAFLRAGDPDKTRQYLARAEAIDANHYRLHAIKAQLAKSENRNEDAVREYLIALERLPKEGVAEGVLYPIQLRLNLAELYRENGNTAAAKQQIALAEAQMANIQVEGPAKAEFLRVRAAVKTGGEEYAAAEADLKQALQLDPDNANIALQYANLLWKLKRKPEARNLYASVLKKDPSNRFALEGLGYLYREDGDVKAAAEYFTKLTRAYPNDYIGYLALGDLFASAGKYREAELNYQKAHTLAPTNPVIVANAANAALENHDVPLAGRWVEQASGGMLDDPRIMRERARYLFHMGKYHESAQLARKALEKLPKDRNASVYLAYDLYNLGRYDDTLAVTTRYEQLLPKEANFPLLSGHVHKQYQLLEEAAEDYSRALDRDPKMVDAYVNRGYVLNDLQNAEGAIQDFQQALELNPKNGIAHLGMAFSNLQLRHGKAALDQVDTAEKLLGESGATHLARATAYRQQRLLSKAEKEYRIAIRYSPRDIRLQLALADTLYYQRKYNDSLGALKDALALQPDDPALIYAQMAHAAAQMKRSGDTLRYVEAAEKEGGDQSGVLLATGDALLTLGEKDAAMKRFESALDAPDANRVDARLAIAKVMAHQGEWDDARQQVSLAFQEARIGEATPATADNLIEAGNIFLGMHDFDLARKMFENAKAAGAADQVVAIALANTYLAQGDSPEAQVQLASLGNASDFDQNYDYKLAEATIYRQRHDGVRALTAFAHANQLAGDQDDVASLQMEQVAGEEGLRVNDRFSVLSDFSVSPIFEDATIYALDARLLGPDQNGSLPPPRSSLETRWTNGFKMHQSGWPVVSGFFQVRNARGQFSLPSEALIISRNTYDYAFNGALNPVLRLGRNSMVFNTGLQLTVRRDRESPQQMNQNLFRQFVYMSTNSFWNWLSIRGSAYHEAGPFTQQTLSSRDLGANLEFTVGRPWGRTALVTGYSVRDLQFHPAVREYFTTSSYAGLSRRIGSKLILTGLAEYLRSWRVQDNTFVLGQALRPAARLEFKASRHWTVNASGAFSRGMGIHDYDNIESGFFISYVRPLRRMLDDGAGETPVSYPLQFSLGVQQDNFINFAGRGQAIWRPVIRLSFF